MKKINRRAIIWENAPFGIYTALTYSLVTPFSIALGASRTIIGLINGIPSLTHLLGQYPGLFLLNKFKNRKLMINGPHFIERGMWGLLGLALALGLQINLTTFIALFFIITLLNGIISPSWTSLYSDIIDLKNREEIIAKRQILYALTTLIGALFGAYMLDQFFADSIKGFGFLMITGCVFGYITVYLIQQISEPKLKEIVELSLHKAFKIPHNLKKFIIYSFLFSFSWSFGSAFITVYRIEEIGISYGFVLFLLGLNALALIIGSYHWVGLAEKYGDKLIQIICAFFISIIPVANLIATPSTTWVLIPIEILAAVFWAGLSMTSYNLFVRTIGKKHRANYSATFYTITGIATLMGPLLGGIASDHLIIFGIGGSALVLILSSIMRALSILALNNVKEPRRSKDNEDQFEIVFRDSMHFHILSGPRRIFRAVYNF